MSLPRPYYEEGGVTLYCGDNREILPFLAAESIHAVVTDPPYGIGFMGKQWDTPGAFVERKAETRNTFDHVGGNHNPSNSADQTRTRRVEAQRFQVWCEEWAAMLFLLLLPGAHLLAFGGTRTYHRMVCAIEDAGLEIRDCLMWVYGSGFPKSLDVSKAIDKAAGAKPIPTGSYKRASIQRNGEGENWQAGAFGSHPEETKHVAITVPATATAKQWQGWGTALKPAVEPIVLARKPLIGTVVENVLQHGTGALNINASRIGTADTTTRHNGGGTGNPEYWRTGNGGAFTSGSTLGRWPANVIHDGSEEVLGEFAKYGEKTSGGYPLEGSIRTSRACYGEWGPRTEARFGSTSGSASRFFYSAKASVAEREANLDDLPPQARGMSNGARDKEHYDKGQGIGLNVITRRRNTHPTVKPLALMAYLIRLVTPPGGIVLDPFSGSGSTLLAAKELGFRCVGIEQNEEYCQTTIRRLRQGVLPLQQKQPEPLPPARPRQVRGGLFDTGGEA